jgi:23S rRNA (guanosine2251-2'-O)-methyltransferase
VEAAEVLAAAAPGAAVRPEAAAAADSAADVADSKRNLVYGLHAIGAVIDRAPERLLELWVSQPRDDARTRNLIERAQAVGVRVQAVGSDALHKLAGDVVHQGAVAAVRPLKPWNEDDLGGALSQITGDPLLLVLDGVTDPHNLGACLRTADAAGVHAVIIPKDRAATVDGVVRKVAAGAAEFVPVAAVTNLARTLDMLKEREIWVVGTDGDAAQSLYSCDLKRPLAMVLGAEGSGMRRLTRERCDFLVRIPMAGQVASLNVSVAAGVALFEACRQRGG